MSVQRCVFVDGNALVHRAFHAIPLLTTSKGEPTNAVFGFTSMLLKALQDLQPDCIAVAFDTAAPTFRKQQFEQYKAHRPKMPPELASQFPRVREIVQALAVPIFELEGFEADDLLGTLSLQAKEQGFAVTIVTGDLDALQLVDEDVSVMINRRGVQEVTVYTPALVRERYGFGPELIPDYKALVGDASDNIPKVPGVGDKTAADLLSRHGSIDGLYEHLSELKPKLTETLLASHDQVFQSRDLARIRRDTPIVFDSHRARRTHYSRADATLLLQELEFRSLVAKLPVDSSEVTAPVTVHQSSLFDAAEDGELAAQRPVPAGAPDTSWRIVDTEQGLADLVHELEMADCIAFDVETTGTDALRCDLVGIALSGAPGWGAYLPVAHAAATGDSGRKSLPLELVRAHLGALLARENRPKIAHNAKFDVEVLVRHGLDVRGLTFDTMIAAYLLNLRSLGLKDLAQQELGIVMTPITDLIGTGSQQRSMADVPVELAAPYACADVDVTQRLAQIFRPRLVSAELQSLNDDIEVPLIDVLAQMELSGIAIDSLGLKDMSQRLAQQLLALERRIVDAVGHSFNINSPAQLGKVLFEELELPLDSRRRTKIGYPTGSDVLEDLRPAHPVVGLVLEFRELAKLKSTYVDRLPALVNPATGRVHTSFKQHVVSTGRLSSTDPNLQNIPVRTELGREIRRAFVPGHPDWLLLSADYSQIELRILAHLSGDPSLTAAFLAEEDIHAATASRVFRIAAGDVQPQQRRMAKVINFGILYGMGPDALARQIDSSRKEAQEFIAQYFQTFPQVQQFIENTKREAAENGFVTTITGRRRSMEELRDPRRAIRAQAERAAVNAPVQGSAADIIKIAMVRLHRLFREQDLEVRMLLQVHDELVFELPATELRTVAPLVRATMEEAYRLSVPLRVESKSGPNWADLRPVDEPGGER
ncbi:MAG: DNA polymerase I [Chloroflexi bacterium]|nr:DNA polymerase I [Chloroflexota bacterium]